MGDSRLSAEGRCSTQDHGETGRSAGQEDILSLLTGDLRFGFLVVRHGTTLRFQVWFPCIAGTGGLHGRDPGHHSPDWNLARLGPG